MLNFPLKRLPECDLNPSILQGDTFRNPAEHLFHFFMGAGA